MNFNKIEEIFKKHGFLEARPVSLNTSLSFEHYKAQIWNQNYGSMEFLKEHLDSKNPNKQQYTSAFIALYPYYPPTNELQNPLRVSVYAQQKDYHFRVNEKLQAIVKELEVMFPQKNFANSVDSAPVLERDLAYRAGLGWIGKNTCLLNKEHGSLFYIAEILSDIDLEPQHTFATDHCGTCTRCLDVCPTEALTPRKLEVDKCISYRNIEDKDCSPESLAKPLHSWFFGCDLCQTVCPWNEKTYGKQEMETLTTPFEVTEESVEELKNILSKSNKQLAKDFASFPLSRARGTGLKRNALKLIYEHQISELKDFLKELEVSEQLQDLKNVVYSSL